MGLRLKLTLWHTAFAAAAMGLMALLLYAGSVRILNRYYADTLAYAAQAAQQEISAENGLLEVDDDLRNVPDVHIALYSQHGNLIYGRTYVSLPFEEGALRAQEVRGEKWYVLDTLVELDGLSGIWLRCAKRADVQSAAYGPMLTLGYVMLALLLGCAAAGGYVISGRALRPVGEMASAAREIVSAGDLGRRVGLRAKNTDELTALARTIDEMLERLDDSFRRERQFTSDAAHELRTPLTAMKLLCEEALTSTDEERRTQILGEMMERMDALTSLVGQLLSLSRLESGRMVSMERTDLSSLCARVAQELEPVAQEAEVELRAQVEPGIEWHCDPSLMTRLCVNLLDNAIRYGRKGGYAQISLSRTDAGIALCVQDDGIGMSGEEQAHAFERFWRADAARSTPGTGLGLAIVRWIVQCHGGQIDVSGAPGAGTKFTIQFFEKTS